MPQLELKGHTGGVNSVAFSPDGTRVLAGGYDRTAKVWDARTGTPLLDLKGHARGVSSVAFSPDGTRIATSSDDGTAKVWDARTGTPLLDLKGHTGGVSSAAFSADGIRIVTGSDDRTAKVWEARTGMPQLDLKGHTGLVTSAAFSPDGTRVLTGSEDWRERVWRVWDARTGTPQLKVYGPTGQVSSAAFSADGTRIVILRADRTAEVWDLRTGWDLKGEPIPQTTANNWTSPDGRFFAHPDGSLVQLVPLQPDGEELFYHRLHTQPNVWRYREGYEAARAANDEFAARFYLKLLPPPEQKAIEAQDAADREIAAGRTQNALAHLVILSVARPDDTMLFQNLAALQAWFGQDKELADTCRRGLASAKDTIVPETADRVAKACCVLPSTDKAQQEAALALARKAVQLGKDHTLLPWFQLGLGMAEYRGGHFAEADAALMAAEKAGKSYPYLATAPAFYRAMSLFRQGKADEARKLATEAAATMTPLPKDEKNPLAGDASPDDLILWLAYKEAKALIGFDAAPPQDKK
jgi:hypothetical protein